MRLIVTGGAGFIGSAVVRMAVEDGRAEDVIVIDNLGTGLLSNLSGVDVRIETSSILDADALLSILKPGDAVIHLAALPSVPRSVKDPLATNHTNVSGSLALLEICRAVGASSVTVASSSSVYGRNTVMPKPEDTWLGPLSPYAVSKLATEAYALAYQSTYGLKTTAFRFFNVYGPRQRADSAYPAVVPAIFSAILNDRPFRVFGDGEQIRDFTFVETVAEVLLDAALSGQCSAGPINLAFGTRTSVNALIREVESVTGARARIEYAPSRPGDVRESQADNTRLASMFPSIVPVPLRKGLMRTYEWLLS